MKQCPILSQLLDVQGTEKRLHWTMTSRTAGNRSSAKQTAKGEEDASDVTLRSILEADEQKILNPDLKRPFSSIQDAVDRLLPYHILSEETPHETDMREAEATGANLLLSRNDAWQAFITHRANSLANLLGQINKKISGLETRVLDHTVVSPLAMQTSATIHAKRKLDAEQKRQKEEQDKRMAAIRQDEERRLKEEAEEKFKRDQAALIAQQQQLQQQQQAMFPFGPPAGVPAATAPVAPGPSLATAPSVGAVPAPAPPVVESAEEKKKNYLAQLKAKAAKAARKF